VSTLAFIIIINIAIIIRLSVATLIYQLLLLLWGSIVIDFIKIIIINSACVVDNPIFLH